MDIQTQVEQIQRLIESEAASGNVLPKSCKIIADALSSSRAHVIIKDNLVAAYTAIYETDHYLMIGSVVVDPTFRGKNYAFRVVAKATVHALAISTKPVVTIANPQSEAIFIQLGYVQLPKSSAPPELWGGRTYQEWLFCDRKFYSISHRKENENVENY